MRENELFSNKKLKRMIVPLFLEQLLVMLVGIADTLVISYAGEAAEYYFRKLTKITLLISAAWNLLILLLTPVFLHFYSLSSETRRLVLMLVLIHNVFNAAAFPFSGALSNGLRAAGDVKFTMYASVISTIVVRLLLSYVFASWVTILRKTRRIRPLFIFPLCFEKSFSYTSISSF